MTEEIKVSITHGADCLTLDIKENTDIDVLIKFVENAFDKVKNAGSSEEAKETE